jgi:quinol monooxygenase YgiN
MYGTIAKVRTNPENLSQLKTLSERIGLAPGQIARYIYQMDADSTEFYLVAVFDSREAYQANATSPEQHERFMELRALLTADPEWHDGVIVDAAQV